jgi:integrase/recombinase XerD
MTVLENQLAEYLQVRRRLGFKLKLDGYLLADFVAFLETAGAERITSDLSVMWARRPGASARYHMERLSMVRGFARYLATIDPASEIPPIDLLHARENRNAPYLYCEREIGELIAAAAALTPAQRGATYRTVIGVMATSGLRIGETLALDRGDVDLELGVLHIRDGKGRRHRDVPVHHSTTEVLRGYARLRDRACRRPETPAFFISTIGARVTGSRFHKTFRKLIAQVDPQPGREQAHRRPHDLRHTFAVRTLLGWHRAGVDIDRAMPLLSTYLGHSNPSSSYWYLQASPELMALVAKRLDNALGGRS